MATTTTPSPTTTGENYDSNTSYHTTPFNEISQPGAYYFHQTGQLWRVPAECLAPGHSPMINICASDTCFVTKVSGNPWIPVGKARQICSNWDLQVNF